MFTSAYILTGTLRVLTEFYQLNRHYVNYVAFK